MALSLNPTDWQAALLDISDDINLALFGGRGAGRTTGALFVVNRHCEVYGHGARVIFLRQTLRSLREVEDNFQLILASGYPNGGLRFNRQDHEFRLPNHATIEFGPLNDNEDMAKLQGRSFSMIVADEYGNFNPNQMRFVDTLRANLRAGDIPTRMVLLANPGGRGHTMIKQRFIDNMQPGIPTTMEDHTEWVLCPANFNNNPHNPISYERDLYAAANKDKELYRAWAQGAWNIARGAMFSDCIDEGKQRFRVEDLAQNGKEFNPKAKGFFSYVSADWGQSAPSIGYACVRLMAPWGQFPRGSLLLLDEVSSADPDDLSAGMNWSMGRFADAMGDMCDRTKVYRRGCIDDARGLTAEDTLIKGFSDYHFTLERPVKNRRSGWAVLRELLTNSLEANGRPGLWVSDRCVNWWKTVPSLARDQHNAEDVDTKGIDHAADASRYAATFEIREGRINSTLQTLKRFGIGGPGAPGLA